MMTMQGVYEAYVSERKDHRTGKVYGAIWSLPPELIGKKVFVVTEETWRMIESFLNLLKIVIEEKEKEMTREMIKKTLTIKLNTHFQRYITI